MNADALATYINDHLAGSVAAVQLLDDLIAHAAAPDEPAFFIELRDQITAEQQVLRGLLRDLGAEESAVRKGVGWLSEKVASLKLRWDDPGRDGLGRFEALEGLALGIQGKLAGWRALAVIAPSEPALQRLDLSELSRRAESQHASVEARRLAAAAIAFTAPAQR